MTEKNIFGEEKVDKIVFKPMKIDVNTKVKKISDPPPRPLPSSLDDRATEDWTPKTRKGIRGKDIFDNLQKVGAVLKWVLLASGTLAFMFALGWMVFWIMDQYNIGG